MKENSILEKLVANILLELLEAQNASNKASARLAENYLNAKGKDKVPNLEYFPIPNSSIKAFDFELKFALKDLSTLLTESTISKIDLLIMETWELFLTQLHKEGAVSKEEKEELLRLKHEVLHWLHPNQEQSLVLFHL